MKKLAKSERIRFMLLAQAKWRKTLKKSRRALKRKRDAKRRAVLRRLKMGFGVATHVNEVDLLPIEFNGSIDIDGSNRVDTISRCNDIRRGTHRNMCLHINTDSISAVGMLLLYSEVYRGVKTGFNITCEYPESEHAEKVLQHIGFFELLGKKHRIRPSKITEYDILSWHTERDTTVDVEKIHKFLGKISDLKSLERTKKVHEAIVELVANVAEHAYSKSDRKAHEVWVMFGRTDRSDGRKELQLVVGDLGRGIPVTMRGVSKKSPKSDSAVIVDAARGKGSWRHRAHRGKGLKEAVDKIVEGVNGEVRIYSRRGLVPFDRYTNRHQLRRLPDADGFLRGTIVLLSIPLDSKGKA